MDREKIDHLCVALSATFLTVSTEEEMTPADVLCGATRMFAWLAAARAYELGGSIDQMKTNLDAYLADAKTVATARLLTHHAPDPFYGPDEDESEDAPV